MTEWTKKEEDLLAPVGSVFLEDWWLDSVAPGEWRSIEVSEHEGARARMVFVTRGRFGMSFVTNPPLTPSAGPTLTLTAVKREARTAQARALALKLAAKLPQAHFLRLSLAVGYDDFLPFRWRGFDVGVACTHRIEQLHDLEQIWRNFAESTRRAIRKASKLLEVSTNVDIKEFVRVAALSFVRQGARVPYHPGVVERLLANPEGQQSIWPLAAVDRQSRVHAVAMIAKDQSTAYYVLGGADPELRSSGAQSLLMWEAIQRAATSVKCFDFEGSSHPDIERFFRGFAPIRVPVFSIARRSFPLRQLHSLGLLPRFLS